MRTLAIAALLALIAGCDSVEPEREAVHIVAVVYDEETGKPDWYTIVEFPNGERRHRWNKYGEVGDEFTAVRNHRTGGWR